MVSHFAIAVTLAMLLTPVAIDAQQRNAYYPFTSKDDYSAKVRVFRGLVRRYGRVRVNHIYIAKTDSGDGTTFLYGYWPEDHSIWLVAHLTPWFEDGREATDYEWLKYKMRTDLRKDVVPTLEDVGWSSYLVDRPWARRIVRACVRGRRLTFRTRAAR
jgi:hypothetical protein